jgi:hypothetical protein
VHQPAPASGTPNCETTAISEISSLHRSSPLATQQTIINNMSAASLDLERWRASEVVLLDIGKSSHLHCSSPLRHHLLLRRERLQPAPANLCDACNHPARGMVWSGQQPSRAQHTSRCRWFALSRCPLPSACYPSFCSRHGNSSQSACLSCTPFNACNRSEAPC